MDDNVDDAEKFVCLMIWRLSENVKGIDDGRHSPFAKSDVRDVASIP